MTIFVRYLYVDSEDALLDPLAGSNHQSGFAYFEILAVRQAGILNRTRRIQAHDLWYARRRIQQGRDG
jgi:hypothetical protein